VTVLHLDIETRSRADLKAKGLYNYAQHKSTQLMCAQFAFDDEPVQLWVPVLEIELCASVFIHFRLKRPNTVVHFGKRPPTRMKMHIVMGGEVRAHNAAFERNVLNGPAGEEVEFPKLMIAQMVCTMAKAAAHGLPHALEHLAKALDTHKKDEAGASSMRYLCKPRSSGKLKGTFAMPDEEPLKYAEMYSYGIDDVEAERAADRVVPDLSPNEQLVYQLDQRMNDRGWAVDLEANGDLMFVRDQYKAELKALCRKWTGVSPSQTGALADWVRKHGYATLENLQVETVNKAVKDPVCPDEVKRVLRLFSTYNMKAVAKYDAIGRAVCDDGRLHGMFYYHGANTGRWSSKIVQLQNLYRPKIEDAGTAIRLCRRRDEALKAMRWLYDGLDPMKVLGSCVRGVLVSAPGRDLLFPDYAGIESRVNAWLWNEEWKLRAFEAYDAGTGPDLYKVAYSRAFGIPIDQVTKAQRQVGKVMELALGYEGGVAAFVKMVSTYGIDLQELTEAAWPTLPEAEKAAAIRWLEESKRRKQTYDLTDEQFIACDVLKRLWRDSNPRIKAGWAQLKEVSLEAVKNPGRVYKAAGGKLMFKVVTENGHQWLVMRLPGGRRLWYYKPFVKTIVKKRKWPDGRVTEETEQQLRFYGTDTYTRKWGITSTYGGKLDENAVQAISRDLLVAAKFKLERAGYDLIGSVHDEPIMEIDEGWGSLDEASALMCETPSWAVGLPIAVEGHRAKRYRK